MKTNDAAVKVYRVPTPRWAKLFEVPLIIIVATICGIGYVYLIAAAVATLFSSQPLPSLPPLWVSVSMLVIITLAAGLFLRLGLINPLIIELREHELVAICALKTQRIEWHEIDHMAFAWFFPKFARGTEGYEVKYPLVIRLKERRFPGSLFLLSFCVSGQDSLLEAELRRRIPVSDSKAHR